MAGFRSPSPARRGVARTGHSPAIGSGAKVNKFGAKGCACVAGAAPSLIREVCEAIKRALVLGPRMSLATDLPSILQRVAAGCSAAEGMPVPRLWAEPRNTLQSLRSAPWPPERTA